MVPLEPLCSCIEIVLHHKPSKILIQTSSAAEYIESDIQNIKTPRTYDPII